MTTFTETVTGATTPVEVYGGLAACADYLLSSSSDGAVAFRALATDDQKRRLIDATRYVDQQFWQGTRTGLVGVDSTTLAFPRTGLTDEAGAALDSTTVPRQVVEAAFEMAGILASDSTAAGNADQGSNVQSLGAGPASLSFFRPTSAALGTATVLPVVVDRLVGRWLASAGAVTAGVIITGASARSDFRDCTICGSRGCGCSGGRRDRTWPL